MSYDHDITRRLQQAKQEGLKEPEGDGPKLLAQIVMEIALRDGRLETILHYTTNTIAGSKITEAIDAGASQLAKLLPDDRIPHDRFCTNPLEPKGKLRRASIRNICTAIGDRVWHRLVKIMQEPKEEDDAEP